MNNFSVSKTIIEGVLEIKPVVFEDERGSFLESFNKSQFKEIGVIDDFVQDNQSISKKGVLRGMHFQVGSHNQGKLVRVVSGGVLDVVIDLRKESPTFGKWYSVILNSENKKMLWVPKGSAHGFLSLENNTVFQYKCSNYYNKDSEKGIIWNDKNLSIDWQLQRFGINNPIINQRDSSFPCLTDIDLSSI